MSDSNRPQTPATSFTRPRSWSLLVAWTLCALFAIACGWLWQLHLAEQSQIALLRDQQQLAELDARNARQHAEAQHLIDRRLLEDAHRQLDELTRKSAP